MATDYAPLWFWVREREVVRVKRERSESAPWTSDPIIGKYRFCNVRREDDRVTVWIRENIRNRFRDHPHLWLMLCIARQINLPSTLADLIDSRARLAWPHDDFNPSDMAYIMEDIKLLGRQVYTGAYTITAPPTKGASKIDFTCNTVIGQLWRDREKFAKYFAMTDWASLAGAHELLSGYTAWGNFMAYQAVVDMRFTPLLSNARDVERWCAAGPGTIRGLNRLHGRKLTASISQDQARSEIARIYAVAEKETGVAMDFSDVPNILCETDKYLRVKNGEGEPRALYHPQEIAA